MLRKAQKANKAGKTKHVTHYLKKAEKQLEKRNEDIKLADGHKSGWALVNAIKEGGLDQAVDGCSMPLRPSKIPSIVNERRFHPLAASVALLPPSVMRAAGLLGRQQEGEEDDQRVSTKPAGNPEPSCDQTGGVSIRVEQQETLE